MSPKRKPKVSTLFRNGMTVVTSGETTHRLINRAYRSCPAFQWLRETLINSLEAGATHIGFIVEEQAVKSKGVFRRMVVDDGVGMDHEELVEFFKTYGHGGKEIGGAHENFGIGAKNSLFPWNPFGVVLVSKKDGRQSMIWIAKNPATGSYGLRRRPVAYEDDYGNVSQKMDDVYAPYNDPEYGCDWSKVIPSWVGDHGTAIVLLGKSPKEDTLLGDVGNKEGGTKGTNIYLNTRLWEIPKGVKIMVTYTSTTDKSQWPKDLSNLQEIRPSGKMGKTIYSRSMYGAKKLVVSPPSQAKGSRLKAKGTVTLDGADLDWYLREGQRPTGMHTYFLANGFIAYLYKNELYEIKTHPRTFHKFGIVPKKVRDNLYLIIRPHVDPKGKLGVFPESERGGLHWLDPIKGLVELPFDTWADEFSEKLPKAITRAIKSATTGISKNVDAEEMEEILKLLRYPGFDDDSPPPPPPPPPEPDPDDPPRPPRTRSDTDDGEGKKKKKNIGIPRYRTSNSDDVGGDWIASWIKHDHEFGKSGCILLNVEHRILTVQVERWKLKFPSLTTEVVSETVWHCYGIHLGCKIAFAKMQLRRHMTAKEIDNLLQAASLTFACGGLFVEDKYIEERLKLKLSQQKRKRRSKKQ